MDEKKKRKPLTSVSLFSSLGNRSKTCHLDFGSEARGDARVDSDIDLLILLEGDQRDFRREEKISGALYDVELSTGVLISPMIILRKQWENRPFKTPFYVNIMNEGIKL